MVFEVGAVPGPWERLRATQRADGRAQRMAGNWSGGFHAMTTDYQKGPRPDGSKVWRKRWEQRQTQMNGGQGPAVFIPEDQVPWLRAPQIEKPGPWELLRRQQKATGNFQPTNLDYAKGPRSDGRAGWRKRWEDRQTAANNGVGPGGV